MICFVVCSNEIIIGRCTMMCPFTTSHNNQSRRSCDVCIELITTPPPIQWVTTQRQQSTQSMVANKMCKLLCWHLVFDLIWEVLWDGTENGDRSVLFPFNIIMCQTVPAVPVGTFTALRERNAGTDISYVGPRGPHHASSILWLFAGFKKQSFSTQFQNPKTKFQL